MGVAKVVSSFQKTWRIVRTSIKPHTNLQVVHVLQVVLPDRKYMGKYNICDEGSQGAEEPHDPTVAQIVISPFVRQLSRPSDPVMRTDPKVSERRASVSWRASMSLKACAQKKPHT